MTWLELARVGGRPLALRDVTPVLESTSGRSARPAALARRWCPLAVAPVATGAVAFLAVTGPA
ncbi:hypothetical protein RM844_22095 [Streptomyces sp. DSM 44915]|uniref:Uncharacterized protein n=1 Tax=Streptomyces chisholmiae TaxID=3075540 RepID=A0ABU2JVG9_9ACTN|nr:hypothetical protein [Streptomyces sp. DSM 44915]MDT0268981.1 hypothetical protein [Streptomyces sp. DSM 44915]